MKNEQISIEDLIEKVLLRYKFYKNNKDTRIMFEHDLLSYVDISHVILDPFDENDWSTLSGKVYSTDGTIEFKISRDDMIINKIT